ncbi:hypothetical protein B0H14DRAFT_3468244 [Mycena olivaceomarginata]|nr:hypothetical protein B0H14DRAFT_3468244 [Mycena olivaceomarginata]
MNKRIRKLTVTYNAEKQHLVDGGVPPPPTAPVAFPTAPAAPPAAPVRPIAPTPLTQAQAQARAVGFVGMNLLQMPPEDDVDMGGGGAAVKETVVGPPPPPPIVEDEDDRLLAASLSLGAVPPITPIPPVTTSGNADADAQAPTWGVRLITEELRAKILKMLEPAWVEYMKRLQTISTFHLERENKCAFNRKAAEQMGLAQLGGFFGMKRTRGQGGDKSGRKKKKKTRAEDESSDEVEETEEDEGDDDDNDKDSDGDEDEDIQRMPVKTRGKTQVSNAVVPAKSAKWVESAKAVLLDEQGLGMGPEWTDVIRLWWSLEEASRFASLTKSHPTADRPKAVGVWVKNPRKGVPAIGTSEEMEGQWWVWWKKINPSLRLADGELEQTGDGSWGVLNTLSEVWKRVVGDVKWVLKKMVNGEKRDAESASSTNSPAAEHPMPHGSGPDTGGRAIADPAPAPINLAPDPINPLAATVQGAVGGAAPEAGNSGSSQPSGGVPQGEPDARSGFQPSSDLSVPLVRGVSVRFSTDGILEYLDDLASSNGQWASPEETAPPGHIMVGDELDLEIIAAGLSPGDFLGATLPMPPPSPLPTPSPSPPAAHSPSPPPITVLEEEPSPFSNAYESGDDEVLRRFWIWLWEHLGEGSYSPVHPDPQWLDLSQTRLSTTYREFLLLHPEPRVLGPSARRRSTAQPSGSEAESSESETPAPKRRKMSGPWNPRHVSRPEVVEVTNEDDTPATANDPRNYDFDEEDVQMSSPEPPIVADVRNYNPRLAPVSNGP